jgi:required for meiotic nuclear division protein 1
MNPMERSNKKAFKVRAMLIGDRIDLRSLEGRERLALDPVTVAAGASGIAVVFRYGAAVLFDVDAAEEQEFLRQFRPLVQQPYDRPETETVDVAVDPGVQEGLTGSCLYLSDCAIERLQLVASILSKSTVLSMYESIISRSFDLVEPFARDLERGSRTSRGARELLRYIGTTLISEHKMVGRVEVEDKPEVLWEHPDLERLYWRLEDEFEISERHLALEQKLALVSRTAHTALEVFQDRRSLRVEWYIVILIVLEILLTLWQMFWKRG